jgi:hypothetical protein
MNLQTYSNEELIIGIDTHFEVCESIPLDQQLECKSRLQSMHQDFLKLKGFLTEQYHVANSSYKKAKGVQNKRYYFGRLQVARNAIALIETFNYVNSNCT